MNADARKEPRVDFHLEVAITGHNGKHRILDLSRGGLFIHASNPGEFQPDESIEIVARLPHENQVSRIKARVAHTSGKGIGVRFDDLLPHQAMAVEQVFELFQHMLPLAEQDGESMAH